MNILPRSAWTKTPNNRPTPLSAASTTSITLHYPAVGKITLAGEDQAKTASRLEGWRKMHTGPSRGWRDIGYNYAVDQSGRIWNLTGMNVGAHAGTNSGNQTSAGVLLVLGDDEQPAEALINGVRSLRKHILKTHPRATAVKGHRDWKSTACPGTRVYALIKGGTFVRAPIAKPVVDVDKIVAGALTPVLPKLAEVDDDAIRASVDKVLAGRKPEPTPPPAAGPLAFWLGYWNVTSPSYSDSPGPWSTRGPRVAAALRDPDRFGGCSMYALGEVTTSAMTATFKDAFGSRWRHGGSAIGNDAYDDAAKFQRAFWREYSDTFGGQTRGFSLGEFVRDGKRFNLVIVHGPTGTDPAGIARKKAYAAWVVGRIRGFNDPTIVVGDFNHSTHYGGSLADALKKIGYTITDDAASIDKIAVKGATVTDSKTIRTGSSLSTHPAYQYRIQIGA